MARLYRLHDLAYRTQYAEMKERAGATPDLLRGTPGTLYKRAGTGHAYWYRIYYAVPGKQAEEFVGAGDDIDAYEAMSARIEFAEWMTRQVANLRKLGYQVADKGVASVMVELCARRVFDAGLTVVGTLAYMAWLNEYGAMAVATQTQDVDLARRQQLKLATPISFLSSMQATQLPFRAVPGMPSHGPSMPHYDYLLTDSRKAAMLAGGACIPVALPGIERMIWHKLYSSAQKTREAGKAAKDRLQAATLAALVVEQDGVSLRDSFRSAPDAVRKAVLTQRSRLLPLLADHPETRDAFESLES